MNHIYLALGSNVGDKKKHIFSAIKLLSEKVTNIHQAPLYESKAVGFTEQDNFLNTVISGKTDLSPGALLAFVKDVEIRVGRIQRFRWGPREIDIDILFYDDLIRNEDRLEIPHPRLHERDFVLIPFIQLNPTFIHPRIKKTVKELLESIPVAQRSIMKIIT